MNKQLLLRKIAKAERLTVDLIATPEMQDKTASTLLAVLNDIRNIIKGAGNNDRY